MQPQSFRQRTRSLTAVAVALAAVLIVANGAALAIDRARGGHGLLTAGPQMPFKISQAVSVTPVEILAASLGNELALVEHGSVTHRAKVDGTIGAVAVRPGGGFYVGTTTGNLYTFSTNLAVTDKITLPDRIVGLGTAGRDLLVAHGAGAFSSAYYVSRFRNGEGRPETAHAAFTITAFTVLDGAGVYGTVNSKVGMIDRRGHTTWNAQLPMPVTALAAAPQRRWILVGDHSGSVVPIDGTGHQLGSAQVAQVPITALGFAAATDSIAVGDQRGVLHVLDSSGKILLSRAIGTDPIVTIAGQRDGRMLVVEQSGLTGVLDPTEIHAAALHEALVPWWIGANVVTVAAICLLLFTASPVRRTRALVAARRSWKGRLGYLFILPTIVLIVVFSYYPAASSLYYSFTDYTLRAAPNWVGLDNFRQILFHDSYFRVGLLNMLIITVTSFIKAITVPLLAAELVYWLKNRVSQYVFRTIFVLSTVVPGLVLTLLWKRVYDDDGALNAFLRLIGLGSWTHSWLGDDKTALWAVIGVGFPYLAAFPFLILLGGLLAINRDLYDSAAIDGATRWQQFIHIDLAHLRPQLRILAFFAVAGSVEGFAGIFLLTQGGPGSATYVPALEMYLRISGGDLGYAAAIGAILFVLILLLTIGVLRVRRQESET